MDRRSSRGHAAERSRRSFAEAGMTIERWSNALQHESRLQSRFARQKPT
jgi:hypothetical protein